MGKTKAAHHRGTHQARAAKLVAAAKADPSTRCWRCGTTLAAHPPHKNGRPAYWTAGHVNSGEVNGEYRPEASVCNYKHGAAYGNRLRVRGRTPRLNTSRAW